MSRITVFGAAGKAASRVVTEAAARGHHVTAVARDRDRLRDLPEGVRAAVGDVTGPGTVDALAKDEIETPRHLNRRFTVGY
ncbi:NAD(P)H-binding protein [Streptomyces sp. Ag109_G2-15]|uniref:NAD(P)H-binding protein n=1 Tax=Streptomyces sp. Ag109_G2-15 TaxID=1938850 RepID=UPI000BD3ACCD|nr:NAD(P)H-binding protein [Streptomyces sp. Ag109_G2-15]SOE07355.1 NAD(P)H-binding [Streptomyces sp. Ag109_G2-15]